MSDEERPDAISSEPENPEAAAADETLAAAAADTEAQAADGESALVDAEAEDAEHNEEPGDEVEPEPAPKLERLQKILAQAGVASRRHAENLITEGRVQLNGKVITELGTKADAARDHIRVDGKLLHGSERLRYFMLNKPKGFVTTVSDPEKRPTVMEFFAKSRERLYPVGRLDYLSEGLLLVTNDGDLANKLTRAAAGVEKTYLVKVSGEPSEEDLDRLRSGVGIERGQPGSGRVQTAPAQIRKVRQGDNPWYEVILIEGRNRELRKMFEEIGHHVEKIRRVGYGPLVLDIEPGKMRELEPEELEDLRKAADGKLRKPKLKDVRRRKAMDAQLPTLRPGTGRPHAGPPSSQPPAFSPRREFPPKKQFGGGRAPRPERPAGEGFRHRPDRSPSGPSRFGSQRPDRPAFGKGPQRSERPQFGAGRPAWKKDDRGTRPPARFGSGPSTPSRFGQRPQREDRRGGEFAERTRPQTKRPFEKKPWQKREGDRPAFKPRTGPRTSPVRSDERKPEALGPRKTPRLHIEAVEPDRETASRPSQGRPSFRNSGPGRRPNFGAATGRETGTGRPPREEGDRSRPFTTSTGKPRPGGARPSNKRSGPPAAGKAAWKPKPGGSGRPSSSGRSKPAFGAGSRRGGFSKSGGGYKGKPGGGRKSGGPRPGGARTGGKRAGGKPGGKKRG